ncbi:hypothetical protein [Mycobacterium marinum]|uniref:hypothetical protein n=1 Tax=Mycobacterium marinum TaxID=1781 RepID=UPI0023581875|nr:hypothetical protein [Mycobacterium marinum]MDC8973991.1 hypothetical protein [Mycobacterium marinum]
MNNSATVLMTFPAELGGGDPAGLLTSMGLSCSSVTANTWEVGVASAKPLVDCRTLATPWNSDRKFDLLKMYPAGLPPDLTDLYQRTRLHLLPRIKQGNLTALLNLVQVDCASASGNEIPALADHYDREIDKLHNGSGDKLFPNHGTHVVNFAELAYKRSKLAQILMRIDQDPPFSGDLASEKFGELPLGEIFNSNDGLLQSLRVGDMYIAPLLGSLSPGIWAVNCQRLFGSIVFSLGEVTAGLERSPAEPLQLLPHTLSEAPGSSTLVSLPRKSCAQAIDWWSHRLDQMFEYLTNPIIFADHHRYYLPYMHQNWMMTIEQMFRRIASIHTSHRDSNAQLVLMFSVMDIFGDRVTEEGQKLYKPARAEQALATAQNGMPPRVADLVIPKAVRAANALRAVQDGFFIKNQRKTTSVKLVNDRGDTESWDMGTATQRLLRARRNAVHGFGGLKNIADDAVRILAQHDGNLPQDLVDLPYLYLLEFLCSPEKNADMIRAKANEWNKPGAV